VGTIDQVGNGFGGETISTYRSEIAWMKLCAEVWYPVRFTLVVGELVLCNEPGTKSAESTGWGGGGGTGWFYAKLLMPKLNSDWHPGKSRGCVGLVEKETTA